MWAVVAHALAVLIHSAAHLALGVKLAAWQNVYVWAVIVVMPLVAGAALRRGSRGGFLLLGVSMLGSLLFGGYYHFIDAGADHVCAHGQGRWQTTFLWSAALLSIVETLGALFALRAFRGRGAWAGTPRAVAGAGRS